MAEAKPRSRSGLQRWLYAMAPVSVLVLLSLGIGAAKPIFFSHSNLLNVVNRNVPLALIAIGETVVIIAAQIDLGVGSVMALSAVSAGLLYNHGVPFPLALTVGLLLGGLCGLINGVVTTKAKMPSFVVTLAMMGLARGLALVFTKAQTVGGEFGFMDGIINAHILSVPVAVWVLVIAASATHVLLAYTVFGRSIYAAGSNEQAARLSGIRTERAVNLLFALNGALVGLAGLIMLMQNTSAEPTMGGGIELDAIAAVVIGGASLSGGQGSVLGTLVGVAIMAVLQNGCNLLNVANEWSKVVIAPLIVLAVLYDRWLKAKSRG